MSLPSRPLTDKEKSHMSGLCQRHGWSLSTAVTEALKSITGEMAVWTEERKCRWEMKREPLFLGLLTIGLREHHLPDPWLPSLIVRTRADHGSAP